MNLSSKLAQGKFTPELFSVLADEALSLTHFGPWKSMIGCMTAGARLENFELGEGFFLISVAENLIF